MYFTQLHARLYCHRDGVWFYWVCFLPLKLHSSSLIEKKKFTAQRQLQKKDMLFLTGETCKNKVEINMVNFFLKKIGVISSNDLLILYPLSKKKFNIKTDSKRFCIDLHYSSLNDFFYHSEVKEYQETSSGFHISTLSKWSAVIF